ncbi:MAG: porin [Planctomycetota bacterium]
MRNFGRMTMVFALTVCCARLWAGSASEDLRKEIDELRRQLNNDGSSQATIQNVDAVSGSHCACQDGPNKVTTKAGNLQIGGLLQIWETKHWRDRRDIFSDRGGELLDNSGNRIRRAELKFTIDIHENVTAVVMFDAAREATSFPGTPSSQGLFKSAPASVANQNGTFTTGTTFREQVQTGGGTSNRILQDAYINFHDVIPHHDVTVGQFKPSAGEEGVRSSANLDFAERAMVNQINDLRDTGIQVHGTWWQDCDTKIGRLQYWVGAFNGAGNYFNTAGDFQNRSDDNDSKDVIGKLMVRPIWSDCLIGRLELGVWGQYGKHGETGDHSVDGSQPANALNRLKTNAHRLGAWAMYKPMGCLRGIWLRGEYGEQSDRTAPFTVNAFGLGSGPNGEQASPNPIKRQGWYAAAGYKLTDSIFAERLSKGNWFNRLVEPTEFVTRYESFENIVVENAANPDQLSDLYRTRVFTAGVNYYVNAYKHRIQINYMNVQERVNANQHPGIRGANDNMYVMSYQIQF